LNGIDFVGDNRPARLYNRDFHQANTARRLRLRRVKFVPEQFFLAAVAQNIKRLVPFLSQPITPTVEAAS